MTTDVVTAGAADPVDDAAVALLRGRHSALPVVDADRRLLGVVSEADLLADAGRIEQPAFLIHSSANGLGGEELNPQYHGALKGPKAIWDIPESSHTGGFAARPKEYERRVVGFFDRALRSSGSDGPDDSAT